MPKEYELTERQKTIVSSIQSKLDRIDWKSVSTLIELNSKISVKSFKIILTFLQDEGIPILGKTRSQFIDYVRCQFESFSPQISSTGNQSIFMFRLE